MAKPSGVKITFAIDQLAEWFGNEIRGHVSVSYTACTWGSPYWCLDGEYVCEEFMAFSAMRRWMEAEIRRRRILFRRFP